LKEWKCVLIGHHDNIGKVIEEWERKDWRFHSHEAVGTPHWLIITCCLKERLRGRLHLLKLQPQLRRPLLLKHKTWGKLFWNSTFHFRLSDIALGGSLFINQCLNRLTFEIPRIMRGKEKELETLINEEALPF